MKNTEIFKKNNIMFNKIDEDKAENIMLKEYPSALLFSYSNLFEKYFGTDKKGTFVSLDFTQLYYLAIIDEQLRQILMRICLEIELKIKTIFLADVQKLDVEENFLNEYIQSDLEYLSKTYPNELEKIKSCKETSLYNFLNSILFGTFEKLIHSFYRKYAQIIYGTPRAPFEKYLSSVRKIRNMVAHNSPFLSELKNNEKLSNNSLSPFLSSKGIKSKTLHTNLSKPIMFDLCNILRLYCGIQPLVKIKKNAKEISKFIRTNHKKYVKYFKTNLTLSSSYRFFKDVVKIFSTQVTI